MPIQEPGRQELMNAGPHHAKLRVTAHLAAPVFVAGADVTGKIDVECRAEKGLGLGTIMVELMAIQELNSRDHAATSTFIHTRRIFQGPGLPPSNAVLAEQEHGAFPAHHYPARRGITTFFFRLPLPLTSPASIEFGSGLARIRYEIKASASVAWKGERRLVTDCQDVQVVESATQEIESAGTVVGESGKIWMQAKALGGAVIAGRTCCIELHVKNHSSRKTTGVNVSLRRVLHLDNPPPQSANLVVSDTLVNAPFHDAEYRCPPGVEGVAKLVINVPRTARTVKGGSRESGEAGSDKTIPALFDIRGCIHVRLCMGVGAKDMLLDLPVVIAHPTAIPPEQPANLRPSVQDIVNVRPTSPYSQYEPPRSPFAPIHSAAPHYSAGYPHPPMSPAPYTQVYFPPMSPQPPNILNYFPAPPMSPALPIYPAPPMSPGPYSPVPPSTPGLPPPPLYQGGAYGDQVHRCPPEVPRLPVPPHMMVIPQFGQTQSMPQLWPHQPPHQHDSLLAGNQLPPLPLRPTSAEPHVHKVEVALPPATGASSPTAAHVLSIVQTSGANTDPVEGKGARASRISEHLRMSSRTRSVSPTGRRFPGAAMRSVPIDQQMAGVSANPEVLSPRPMPSLLPETVGQTIVEWGSSPAEVHILEDMASAQGTSEDRTRTTDCEVITNSKIQLPAETSSSSSPQSAVDRHNLEETSPYLPGVSRTSSAKSPGGPRSPATPTFPVGLRQAKPLTTDVPRSLGGVSIAKPLQPVSTGLTALERRLTTRSEVPHIPVRSVGKQSRTPASPSANKTELTNAIDWGEIARIGKLKSFALAKKKPAVTSFTPLILPPNSFDKPKRPPVTRKPAPSLEPVFPVVRRDPVPPSLPPISQVAGTPTPPPILAAPRLIRYQLNDPPVRQIPNGQNMRSMAGKTSPTTVPHSQPGELSDFANSSRDIVSCASAELSNGRGHFDASQPAHSPRRSADGVPLGSMQHPDYTPQPLDLIPQQPNKTTTPLTTPAVLKAPEHIARYQLTDSPVPKFKLRPISTPAPPQAPLVNIPDYRAVLKPVSVSRPPSPSKRKLCPAHQPALNVLIHKSPTPTQADLPTITTPTTPSVPVPDPASKSLRYKDTIVADRLPSPPHEDVLSLKDPDPCQPQAPSEQGIFRKTRIIAAPPSQTFESSTESRTAEKARYFESLAAAKVAGTPVKPNSTSEVPRQVFWSQEPNRSSESARPTNIQPLVLAQPTHRAISPARSSVSPVIRRDDHISMFAAASESVTAPTTRSLIPTTSSGFEVPTVLPGRDARERADAALREAELFRLKREAVGRVSTWLSEESEPQVPPPTRIVRSSGQKITVYANWDLRQPLTEEPTVAELLARVDEPVARAVYDPQLKHPRPRLIASSTPSSLLPDDVDLLTKYDVRSARGGKGGQVAAVASIWQNAASKPGFDSSRPSPTLPTSPTKVMLKSASVPTMVHPATAVPVLASAASLARSAGSFNMHNGGAAFLASIPESRSDAELIRPPKSPGRGKAVGQARLRELIGKYQP